MIAFFLIVVVSAKQNKQNVYHLYQKTVCHIKEYKGSFINDLRKNSEEKERERERQPG